MAEGFVKLHFTLMLPNVPKYQNEPVWHKQAIKSANWMTAEHTPQKDGEDRESSDERTVIACDAQIDRTDHVESNAA